MTPEQVRAFQSNPAHVDHLGRRLRADGDLGPLTRWAMELATLALGRQAFIHAAQHHIGLVEVPFGSNDDPQGIIQGWLERCPGAKPGDPWCAASMSALLSQVLPKPVRIAGALRLVATFPRVQVPVAGDICGYPTNDRGSGHVFAIAGVQGDLLMTLEGNCDNAFRCVRRWRTPAMIFGRPFPDASGTCPGVLDVPFAGSATR
jgi:hypothetical protein